ncbi:MAG: hypothetical protein ACTHOE_13550 [Conexibacter sp.]
MHTKLKVAVTLAVTLATMGLAVDNAAAVTASIANAGAVALTGALTFEGSGLSIACPLTLNRSLLRGPITVVRGAQIGEVTEVRIGACSSGSIERVLNLPWRLTINDFLPTITSLTTTNATGMLVNIVGFAINFSVLGFALNCLYRGTLGLLFPLTHTAAGSNTYTMRSAEFLRAVEIPLFSGEPSCPTAIHASGRFTLSTVQTVTLS